MTELITYDTIRKAHRAEKQEIALQKLPDNFLAIVRGWLSHKQDMQKSTASLLEIENAKRLLEDLVNRRQKKLVLAALHTVRGDAPPQSMAFDEEKFFDNLVNALLQFKRETQEQMFGYDSIIEEKLESVKALMDEMKAGSIESRAVANEPESRDAIKEADESGPAGKAKEDSAGQESRTAEINLAGATANREGIKEAAEPKNTMRLRITGDIPGFVDAEMKSYGPFKAGMIAEVPNEIAQILLARKTAEAA